MNLQQLHEQDWDQYPAFIHYMTLSPDIDKFVKRVNAIVNAQEFKPLGNASVYSDRSVLDVLDMSMINV